MIIRYGEKVMCYVENEEQEQVPYKVIEFIAASLKEDDLQFHSPLHRKILNEAVAHEKECPIYFGTLFPDTSGPGNQQAGSRYGERTLPVEQISFEKSENSSAMKNACTKLIPRLLIDFKLSIVEEEMKHTLLALAQPEIAGNPEKAKEIMERYKTLHQTQMLMARNAGDRIVNPFS